MKLLFYLEISIFLLCTSYLTAQQLGKSITNLDDKDLRIEGEACFQLSGKKFNSMKIDSSHFYLSRSIQCFEKVLQKNKLDSQMVFAHNVRLAILNEYMNKNDAILPLLEQAYLFLNKKVDAINLGSPSSEISLLKHIMVAQFLYANDVNSTKFQNNLNRLKELFELSKGNKSFNSAIKKYVDLFLDIQEKGSNEYARSLFRIERLDIMTKLFDDTKKKFKLQVEIVEQLKKIMPLSNKEDKKIFNSHFLYHSSTLSYTSLFNNNFPLAEEMALTALEIDPTQKWVVTNLVHSFYLQGKYDMCKLYYLRYKDTKHTDGKLIGEIIKTDILELIDYKICDKTYLAFINKIELESKPLFAALNKKITPFLPVICNSKDGVKVTYIPEKYGYEWTHLESGKKLKGKSQNIKLSGAWIIKAINKKNDSEGFDLDTVYVDHIDKQYYLNKLFTDQNFIEFPIFWEKTKNGSNAVPCQNDVQISFSKNTSDFAPLDSVALEVLKNFKPLQDMGCKLISFKSNCVCSQNVEDSFAAFDSITNGLFVYTYFDNNDNTGKLFIKGKLIGDESLPVFDQNPAYNHMLHLHEIFPEILEANETTGKQIKVVLSNIFMGHPIGGYH